MRLFKWTVLIVAAVIALTALFDYATAHEWYDKLCCSDRDCGPALGAEYEGGTLKIETQPGVWMSVPQGMQLRPSADQNWHVCVLQGGVRCVYAPAGV